MADDGVDDLVGAAGIGQEFGEHGTEGDEDADTCGGAPEPVGERLQDRCQVLAGDHTNRQLAKDQGEERMQLHHGDQHDDHRDAREEGENELTAGRDRLGKLRRVVGEKCNS